MLDDVSECEESTIFALLLLPCSERYDALVCIARIISHAL